MKINFWLVPSLLILCACHTQAQRPSTELIRLNQLGFYPLASKIAVVACDAQTDFTIKDISSGKVVLAGKSEAPIKSPHSGKLYAEVRFTELKTPGQYLLSIPGMGDSYPFEIKNNVHLDLAKAAIKNYYFQRLSIPLDERYATQWKRAAGHPDNVVLVHPSAASTLRPAGTKLSSPKGWYDAGDYNKYIVNSGITMGTMFSAYEDFPDFYNSLPLNIPESGNDLPDLLDELLWNLRWMLTMQDQVDGGVYHKLTNAQFDGMVMPDKAVKTRYVVQKSTAATLDFAAVTAQAARIFKAFDKQLPGISDSCIAASRLAYAWATKNPNVIYDQDKLNKDFDPDVVTGAYGDRTFRDEFSWASSELYVSTGEEEYLRQFENFYDSDISVPGWNNVRLCGYYSMIRHEQNLSDKGKAVVQKLKDAFLKFADNLLQAKEKNPFKCVMGGTAKDFVWGSSAVAANQAIVFINAYRISNKKIYLDNALDNLDYLLGRNGTGYSFVTGFGDKTPMHPHHRPSEADGVKEPIPGMLSGGPNPGMQDKCKYNSSFADEAFSDDVCSYASNEIAINWNAPLVYLTGAIEALQFKSGYSFQDGK